MSQERFIIQGKRELSGEVPIFGAKNHVLKMIPAALLSKEPVTITNVPDITDVSILLDIMETIGCVVEREGRSITITAPDSFDGELPAELVPTLRASIVLLGPLLARYGTVTLPHPGGDKIGLRPINFFVDGLEALGATAADDGDHYTFSAQDGLRGADYTFPQISVTGTETLMLAAVLANGTTVLHNVAVEPEVVALGQSLAALGAQIEGIGSTELRITGGDVLSGGEMAVIPDRIEAGSFLMLAAASGSHLRVTGCEPEHLRVPIELLSRMGVEITLGDTWIEVQSRSTNLTPLNLVTHEYPGFPTDLQAPMTVVLTQAAGVSSVRETIYDGRLFYTDSLNAMGAKISMLDPYRVTIEGATPLFGTTLESPDIRAGIAQVIAGLIAQGETRIHNIYHVDRGYESIEKRLQAIGADITRVEA